jgi:hypothetical protein
MSAPRSATRPTSRRRPIRALGMLAAGALTILVTTGASLSPPEDPVRQRVPDPGAAVGGLVGDGGLVPAPVRPVAGGQALKGLFKLDPASCASGPAKGSFFRMIQPGGGANGPYIENNTSACGDKTYTDLTPGKDGGLSTMGYQPQPNPPFDASGSGTNDRITLPKDFFGAKFATATNPKDPQTGKDVPAPSITSNGGQLSGDLRAFAAAYQGQHFNQGSPKPDGATPGLTGGPGGTYDAATKRFAIEWKSTIVGGPFNNFTGVWHLEGVFHPGVSAAAAGPTDSSSPAGAPAPAGFGTSARLTAAQAGSEQLKGLFRLTEASCSAAQVSGSYFRMIQPGGSAASGPFLSNNSSVCADKSYTDLTPGKDGGLSTTAYQPQPNPPFDASNGGINDKITLPKAFFGANFATATNQTDPQMNLGTALPVITHDGAGKLSGDVRAFAAAYQGQHFNQGAPKPDGSTPGATTLLSGTYDKATKKFSLEWASTIVGGPFNNFTGKWHFEGTFEPAALAASPVAATTTAPAATTPAAAAGGSTATTSGSDSSSKAAGASSAPKTAVQTGGLMARTGLTIPLGLPATLLGLGLISRCLGWRPRSARVRHAARGRRP